MRRKQCALFFGVLATALQSSPIELCISFITRARIYIGEKEPKDMHIYTSFYMTHYLSKYLPLLVVMETLIPL